MNTNAKLSKKELEEKVRMLEATIELLKRERNESQEIADLAYECLDKMERKYKKSVQRELSYREMLFVFNYAKAQTLLQNYISREGLRIQFHSRYNYRSN
jgi:hypothetical protein